MVALILSFADVMMPSHPTHILDMVALILSYPAGFIPVSNRHASCDFDVSLLSLVSTAAGNVTAVWKGTTFTLPVEFV